MFDGIFTPDFWARAIEGAIGGAVIMSAMLCVERWKDILALLRGAQQAWAGDRGPSYSSQEAVDLPVHAEPSKRRRPIPIQLAIAAIAGAVVWNAWHADDPMVMGIAGVLTAIIVLSAEILRKEPEPTIEETLPDPFGIEETMPRAGSIALCCVALVLALDQVPRFAQPLLDRLSLSSGDYRAGLFSIVLSAVLAVWYYRIRDGDPLEMDGDKLDMWRIVNRGLLVCAAIIAAGLGLWFLG